MQFAIYGVNLVEINVTLIYSEAEVNIQMDTVPQIFTVQNLAQINSLLQDLDEQQRGPVLVNKENPVSFFGTGEVHILCNERNIGNKFHYVLQMVKKWSLVIKYTSSRESPENSFTNTAISQPFQEYLNRIGVMQLHYLAGLEQAGF